MHRVSRLLLSVLVASLVGPAASAREPVTVAGLASRLFDLTRLPVLEEERGAMASSVDITGENNDWAHWVDTQRDEFVPLAELTGPGYVSRLWVTGWADNQRLFRLEVDDLPPVEMPFRDLFGGRAPFVPPWSRIENACGTSYVPIPYAKSLRLSVKAGKPGGTFYFQINHTRLPKGTPVQSFQLPLAADQARALEEGAARWAGSVAPPAGPPAVEQTLRLAPGSHVDLPEFGPNTVIREIRVRPEPGTSAVARVQLLRDVVVTAFWEGSDVPSVEAPLGDLFGQVWRAARFSALTVGSDGTEWYNRHPMPFDQSARLHFFNEGDSPHAFTVKVWTETRAPRSRAAAGEGYFHAGFQRTEPEDVGPEHPILRIKGDGKYVGCFLSVVNQEDSWWSLEGDESIRVDEEQIPGWRGTGLEDMFNGGWYYQEIVANPFSGVLFKAPYKAVQYRLHTLDAPRFRHSIDVQMERGGQNNTPVWMESTSFYYLRQPQAADTLLYSAAARRPPVGRWDAATIMTDLGCLDKLGDTEAAITRIEAFNAALPETRANPYRDLLELRRLALVGDRDGFATVRAAIENLRTAVTNADLRAYADDWLWAHAAPTNGLIAIFAHPEVEVQLAGRSLGKVGSREFARLLRVPLTAGNHDLALSCATRQKEQWLHVMVLAGGRTVAVSDASWRYAHDPAPGWEAPGADRSGWSDWSTLALGAPGPILPALSLVPHPVPGFPARTGNIGRGVPEGKALTVYHHRFTVPGP
jgi:hypothetical protein